MEFLVAQILSGVSLGGQYALIAIGYTMVYGILRRSEEHTSELQSPS